MCEGGRSRHRACRSPAQDLNEILPLHERGYLRQDLSVDEARDILWLYSSPELYELLVLIQAWSIERYARFVAEAMIAALLPPEKTRRGAR